MEYRRFGRTEFQMPLISSGGMRFQTSWQRDDKVKPESVAKLERIVAHALDLGIYHLETAFGYGTSELELGQVLPNFDRRKLLLQTKVGPEYDLNKFLGNLETSKRSLGVDYLDLFAIHGLNNDDLVKLCLQPGGIVDEMEHRKAQGEIRALGFSTHGPRDTIVRAIETGRFDYVNLWFSYINQTNWPAIEAAQQQDMGVFIISPNDKGGRLYDPPARLCQLTAPLSPMTFNDLFILNHPEIHTISCGVAQPEDFDEHVQAVARRQDLQTTIVEIQQDLDRALAEKFDADWAQHYTQGLPAWQDTPGQMNIPIILWLWNLVQAFDMKGYAAMRYNLMGNAEHWFPGNKADKLAELDLSMLRQALANSPYPDRILDILAQAHEQLAGEEVKRLSND